MAKSGSFSRTAEQRTAGLEFFTLRDSVGHKTYVRTATMLLLKAVYDVFGAEAAQRSVVEFSIGHGYYVHTFDAVGGDRRKMRLTIKGENGRTGGTGGSYL